MPFLAKIKHSSAFGIGFYAPKVATLATFPIYARSLSSIDFATLALVEMSTSFFGMLANAGVSNAMLRYYADEDEELGRSTVFTTALVLVVLGGIIVACVLSLLAIGINNWVTLRGDLAKDVVSWLPVIALISVSDAGNSLLQTLFRARREPLGFTVVTLCRVVPATLLGLYLGVWEGRGISGVLIGNLTGSLGSLLICGGWLSFRCWARPQWELAMHLVRYAAPYVPLGIVELISAKAGFICVSALGNTNMIATYSIAEKVGSLVQAAYGPIGFMLTPWMLRVGIKPNAPKLFSATISALVALLGAMLIALGGFAEELVSLISGDAYTSAAALVLPLSLAFGLSSVRPCFRVGLLIMKKTHYMPIVAAVAGAIGFGSTWLLVGWAGTFGAAWGTAFTAFLSVALGWRVSQRFLRVSINWWRFTITTATVGFAILMLTSVPGNALLYKIPLFFIFMCIMLSILRSAIIGLEIHPTAAERKPIA